MISSRERVYRALERKITDRTPVDFLAVPDIWEKLVDQEERLPMKEDEHPFFDPAWESVLQLFEIDCRVISYDQFCEPPEEEQNIIGGLGSAVAEVIAESNLDVSFVRLALPDQYTLAGPYPDLQEYYSLDPKGIAEYVRNTLRS